MQNFIVHTLKQLQLVKERKDMGRAEKLAYTIRMRRRVRSLMTKYKSEK